MRSLALVLALSAVAFAQEKAPDDSNVPEPVGRPEVAGQSAGGDKGRMGLYLPWHLDPSPLWTQDRNWPGTRFWRRVP
jgi:hypothetical protein